MEGVYQRLGLFVRALSSLTSHIHIAHLTPQGIAAEPDQGNLSRVQSKYWDRPVSVTLIGRRSRRETLWNHYFAGILSVAQQPPFFPFGGREQASQIEAFLAARPDIIFVHRLAAMCPVLATRHRPENMFFDLDDVEHHATVRAALNPPVHPGKLAYLGQVPALALMEKRGASLAKLCFVCSELDRSRLGRIGIRDKVAVIPNAARPPDAIPDPRPGNTLLFLGAYHYAPNREAAERLATRIMPLVLKHVPDARLLIAGAGSHDLPSRRITPPGVEYLGFVADLKELYARSKIVCCPITRGGGTRIKLIEAAGYAKPIVSTAIGAEGLSFIDGRDLLIRHSDESFADACVQLLQDGDLCARLGTAARRAMETRYQDGNVISQICELIRANLGAGSHGSD